MTEGIISRNAGFRSSGWLLSALQGLALALILGLTWAVYTPGLTGDFEFDDQANILSNDALAIDSISGEKLWLAAMSGNAGPLGRPISLASFALNHALGGPSPYGFKLTNVLIHVAAAAALYVLTRLLLRAVALRRPMAESHQAFLALAITAAWALHPLNLTSVLYVVQRMTSLAGLFSFLALASYVHGRLREIAGNPWGWLEALAGFAVFAALALLSKESAGILPLLVLAIEGCLLGFRAAQGRLSRFAVGFCVVFVLLPAVAVGARTLLDPQWLLGGYMTREFTFEERLLTQARVLWFYLRLILLPNLSLMGLYHDDFPLSHGLMDPPVTLAAVAGVAALAAVAIAARRKAPVLAFGLAWFLLAHALESTVFPLEMIHEHRNYLPLYGIVFAALYYLAYPFVVPDTLRLRLGAAVVLAGLLGFATYIRADQWGDLLDHAAIEAANHPRSDRANYQLGRLYMKLLDQDRTGPYYDKARFYFRKAADTGETAQLGGLFGLLQLDFLAGRPTDPNVYDELVAKIATRPPASSTINFLDQLSRCQMSAECKLSDAQFVGLVEAMLRNPRINDGHRLELHTLLGVYFFNRIGRPDLSVEHLSTALKLGRNSPQAHLNLARYHTMTAQFDRAEALIDRAAALDRFAAFEAKIRRERELLSEQRKAQSTPATR